MDSLWEKIVLIFGFHDTPNSKIHFKFNCETKNVNFFQFVLKITVFLMNPTIVYNEIKNHGKNAIFFTFNFTLEKTTLPDKQKPEKIMKLNRL